MNDLLAASSEQIKQGGIAALKMLGAVVGAAVILWLVMILARYLGNSIEKRKYEQYVKDYTQDHPDQEGMIGFDQFVSMRASGTKVVYTRDASPKPTSDTTTPTQATDMQTADETAVSATPNQGSNDTTVPAPQEITANGTAVLDESTSTANTEHQSDTEFTDTTTPPIDNTDMETN